MKILLDTNVLIPLEPTSIADLADHTRIAADLLRLAQKAGCKIYVHPYALKELQRDRNIERKSMRGILLRKYPTDMPKWRSSGNSLSTSSYL
jgi:hypothetical protein